LLLACDVRVCVPTASFSLPEVKLGFLPGMATWRLARYVGLGHAKRLVLTGAAVGAEEAQRIGLVDHVVATVEEGVQTALAALAPAHAVAISLARRLLLESPETQYEDALGNFLAAQHRAISQSAFMETLKKERSGR
jgi:enoyl-CoA hydratase/carnithine racemase